MSMVGLMDCNNFFVSCERLFRPDLVNKPVAVLSSNDGCIVARSQEVKDMGIPMGLPLFQAKQLCDTSGITFFSSNFTLYRDISTRVMRVLADEVGACEVYSIDEAFFSLPQATTHEELARLRAAVIQKVGIPVSIGLAQTKTLAKIASKLAKKGSGAYCLNTNIWKSDVAHTTMCGEIWNLGRATSGKLALLQVKTASEFMCLERSLIRKKFGVGTERVFDELQGICVHQLHKNSEDISQSITSTRSFAKSTTQQLDIESALAYHISSVAKKLREKDLLCTRMYVLFGASKHSDFNLRQASFKVVLEHPTQTTQDLLKQALKLVREHFDSQMPYKKAGVVVSGLLPTSFASGSLFQEQESKTTALDAVSDILQNKFGYQALHVGSVLSSGSQTSATLRSQAYTTKWKDIPSVQAQ